MGNFKKSWWLANDRLAVSPFDAQQFCKQFKDFWCYFEVWLFLIKNFVILWKKNNLINLFRTDDSVLYGYQCGETEIFYQQASQKQAGLPPPTDKMGTITSAAKRRLERDHSLVLF